MIIPFKVSLNNLDNIFLSLKFLIPIKLKKFLSHLDLLQYGNKKKKSTNVIIVPYKDLSESIEGNIIPKIVDNIHPRRYKQGKKRKELSKLFIIKRIH